MATLLLDQVEAGAVLAADVADRQGRILLKAGMKLNDKHIRTLQTWGVLEVEIEGAENPGAELETYPDAWLAEAEEKAQAHFRHNPMSHPFIQELAGQWKRRYLKDKEA